MSAESCSTILKSFQSGRTIIFECAAVDENFPKTNNVYMYNLLPSFHDLRLFSRLLNTESWNIDGSVMKCY